MPALMAYMKNQPNADLPPGVVFPKRGPRLPLVFTIQKRKSPTTAGKTKNVLAQKNLFNWYGRNEQKNNATSQMIKKQSITRVLMPCEMGIRLEISVYEWPKMALSMESNKLAAENAADILC